MSNCYFCGMEFSELQECPYCKQKYCASHFATNMHDCPLIPIINPYDLKIGQGNQSVSPDELGAQPFPINNNYPSSQNSYYQQQLAAHRQRQNSSVSTFTTGSVEDSDDYVYTDGTYFWHRKEKMAPDNAFDPSSGVVIPGILWPQKSEFMHVIIASVLLILLVSSNILTDLVIAILMQKPEEVRIEEFLISLRDVGYFETNIIRTMVTAFFYLAAFLVHEFSHRQTAKHFNLQTKFRLFSKGVLMSIICLILPIKMALPGAVVVIGLENIGRETGICKLAGPLSNLIFGGILTVIGLMPFVPYPWNGWILMGAFFNFSLGTFNMIPVGILDGDNIRKWNPKLWLIMFLVLGILALFTFALQMGTSFSL